MPTWEYKMQEFTGTGDEFQELLLLESSQEWQLGAFFPAPWSGDANELAELLVAPGSQVFLMFKRRIPRIRSAASSSLPLF